MSAQEHANASAAAAASFKSAYGRCTVPSESAAMEDYHLIGVRGSGCLACDMKCDKQPQVLRLGRCGDLAQDDIRFLIARDDA